jgi:hypothetical protein
MSEKNEKLTIVLAEIQQWPDSDLVHVTLNGHMFEVMGRKDKHVLASVVTAALLCCQKVKDEEVLTPPF